MYYYIKPLIVLFTVHCLFFFILFYLSDISFNWFFLVPLIFPVTFGLLLIAIATYFNKI